MASTLRKTRIAMMLPGAVSLGAYEGGALAAVLVAVQAAAGQLLVDAMATASAGSMTGLIACRALLCGADPVDLMTATWVDLPSLGNLSTHDPISPLSMARLAAAASGLLGPTKVPDGPFRQACPVRLSMALTALGGLSYRLAALRDSDAGTEAITMLANTYLDWYETKLAPGDGEAEFVAAVDGALASGSTPVGFPPFQLDRGNVADGYRLAGIVNPGDDWHIWYSDGGDIDNEPFGRALDLIEDAAVDADDDRVILVLQTEPPTASWGGKWFDPDPSKVPTWTSTLWHVGHVRKNHSYHEDLRRLEKTNSRLRWAERVATGVEQALESATAALPEAERRSVRDAVARALADAVGDITADQDKLRAAIMGEPPPPAEPAPPGPAPSLLEAIELATGLHGKRRAVVEIISPDIDPADHRPAAEKLAGEFLFHFGGFLDEDLRKSDFALGYRNAMTWLRAWLPQRVADPAAVLGAVQAGYDRLGWAAISEGDASLRGLSLREDAQAAALIAHMVHVVEYGLRHDLHREG